MHERVIRIAALVTALVGLCILFFTAPQADSGFHLQGTVTALRGTHATVLANVTLVARGLHRGDRIDIPVFWGGENFVAVPQNEKPAQQE